MDKFSLIITYFCVFIVLLLLSAFFSSADMAYGSVSELRLESYLKTHNESKRAKYALSLVLKIV